MPPEPMYPDNPMPYTDGHHRWWVWNGHEINLNEADLLAYPHPVRAAVLAHRDATTPEDLDAAAYMVWAVDEHPPWDGGCSTCGTVEQCDSLETARNIGVEFLIRMSTFLVRRSRANIARFDQKRATT